MKLEWSDVALADLDRFAEFLSREHPSLAPIVAAEIIDKVQALSQHPRLGRPIAGREEYRQIVLQVLGAAYVFRISIRWRTSRRCGYFMRANPESDSGLSNRLRHPAKKGTTTALVEAMPPTKKPALPPAFSHQLINREF